MKKILITIIVLTIIIKGNSQIIKIDYKNYTVFYDTILKTPIFSTYSLKKEKNNINLKRQSFRYEEKLNKKNQNSLNDYKDQIVYDKGHLSPCIDFNDSEINIKEINKIVNIVPQNKYLNRGLWKNLEAIINKEKNFRYINNKIITGCEYSGTRLMKTLIPSIFYKIIITNKDTLYYEMPNIKPNSKNINNYKLSKEKTREKIKKNNLLQKYLENKK